MAYGTEGSAVISRNGYQIYDLRGRLVKEEKETSRSQTTDMGGEGDITTKHIMNFIQTVRGRGYVLKG